MKTVNIKELKRNPYYSNMFLFNQQQERLSIIRGILYKCEGRPLTLRELRKIAAMEKEADGIKQIVESRKGADRVYSPLRMGQRTIDITKHYKRR